MDLLTKNASTTQKGVVELATNDEVASGLALQSDDYRLTPIRKDWNWLTGSMITNQSDSGFMDTFGICNYYGNNAATGTSSVSSSDSNGNYNTYTTGAVSGNKIGHPISSPGFTTTSGLLRRKYYPRVFAKFSLVQTTACRFFLGFHSDLVNQGSPPSTFPTGDDILNAMSGFGLYVTSGGAFRIGSNDGSGATVFTSSLAAADTNVHTIYLEADDVNSRWGYSFDNAAMTYVTTDIPAQTTPLTSFWYMETAAAAAKSFRIYNVKIAVRSN